MQSEKKEQVSAWAKAPVNLMPLRIFLKGIYTDSRIRAVHISLYMALFDLWLDQRGENPIYFVSHEIMDKAKISSSTTWHRTVRDLDEFGYIDYQPTFNKMKKSKVFLKYE